jgi:hypothetical protein
MEYLVAELIGDLLTGLFLGRSFDRRTSARHHVLHAARLARRQRLTSDQHAYAVRWLSAGVRHLELFRLGRHRRLITAALVRVQPAGGSA